MIVSEFAEVKRIGNNKLPYFRNLGYNTKDDTFFVKVDHLPISSNSKITAKCDYCDNIVEGVKYKNYIRNLKRSNKYSCSYTCRSIKTKDSNIEKYGIDNPMKSDLIKEKTKKTNIEKYGSEYTFQSEIIKSKIKLTNIEKYGVENVFSSTEIKNKIKQTNLEKYGFENVSYNFDIKNKIKENQLKTNLERYGVESVLSIPEVKEKIKLTNLERYGRTSISQIEKFRSNYNISNNEFYIKYKSDSISLFRCDYGKDHNFEIDSDNYRTRLLFGNHLCTVCNPIGDQRSIKEKDLLEYIKSIYDGEVVSGYRDGLEIDIYLPELKIGIEFNGLYFHSEKFKDKNYHLDKTNHFKERGIRIIHIWEDDWTFKNDVIKSQISNWIGVSGNRIYARNCEIIEILDSKIIRNFLDDNHIQGYVTSSLKIGLFHNSELVSLMTFDHFEGRKKMEEGGWNLSRFCNKINTNVIGGASKLLNYFLIKYKPSRIVSYADKDWSIGSLYERLGFQNINEVRPDYKYIINGERINKSRYRKSRLNTSLSESKFMRGNGIFCIYDCGKIKFEKLINK